jgi:hypothetical protein
MHVNYTKPTAVFSFKGFSISYTAIVVNKSLDNIHHLRPKNPKSFPTSDLPPSSGGMEKGKKQLWWVH